MSLFSDNLSNMRNDRRKISVIHRGLLKKGVSCCYDTLFPFIYFFFGKPIFLPTLKRSKPSP